MLQYRLYGGEHLPPNLEGFVKAGANIGSVIGQFAFGAYPLPARVTASPPFSKASAALHDSPIAQKLTAVPFKIAHRLLRGLLWPQGSL